ncbi:Uncharacterised protein [uncultured archaeon]|nr:Uncharacterised protein [uncultured archaeon]
MADVIRKSDVNLAGWINHQHALHLKRHRYSEPLFEGATIKIANARKALLRSGVPEDKKKELLEKVGQMLQWHKNAAKFALDVDKRGRY